MKTIHKFWILVLGLESNAPSLGIGLTTSPSTLTFPPLWPYHPLTPFPLPASFLVLPTMELVSATGTLHLLSLCLGSSSPSHEGLASPTSQTFLICHVVTQHPPLDMRSHNILPLHTHEHTHPQDSTPVVRILFWYLRDIWSFPWKVECRTVAW